MYRQVTDPRKKNTKALFLLPFVERLFASKPLTSLHHVLINTQSFSD